MRQASAMKPTIFVLGAGASCEFGGFPVGSGLAQTIDSQLTGEVQNRDGHLSSALMINGGLQDEHRAAMARITRGIHSRDSIDQFVDDCRNEPLVAKIAKLAIAHALLSAEDVSELRVDERRPPELILRSMRETWIGYVCRYANPDVNRQNFISTLQNISFVTFNYDRSLERFLIIWVRATLGVSYEIAVGLVSQIPITHVFGQVGHLPGLAPPGVPPTEYGDSHPSNVWRAAQGIKTYTEELESAHGQAVRELLLGARKIVFLGFQYHQPNMRILFEGGFPRAVQVYGTVYEMSIRSIDRLEQGSSNSGCQHEFENEKCLPFMKRFREEILEE